jgi:predicted peptidase
MLIPLLLALQAEPRFEDKTIEYAGGPVKYQVCLPAEYDAAKAMPLILFLHGSGEQGDDGVKQSSVGIGPAIKLNPKGWAPYITVIPQKPKGRGGWMEHEPLMLGVVEKTKKEYKIDESRLYLTGLSMGGYGSWVLAAKHPALWAAVAPICGGGNPADGPKLKDLPLWAFHGDKDTAVPLKKSEEMIEAIKAAGGSPKLTVYPGVGHNSWDKAYRDEKLWEWFLQHSKK